MSDDAITSFLQSHSAIESKASFDKHQENQAQATDFKEVISKEERRLSAARQQSKSDKQTENESSETRIVSAEKATEASKSLNAGQGIDISGNSFPNLSLHDGALSVGRVIYTSGDVAVTSESLSKFMERQGLVNEGLLGEKDSNHSDIMLTEHNELAFANQSQLGVGPTVSEDELGLNPGISEQIPVKPMGDDAVTQLAVKQVINSRGVVRAGKLEDSLARDLAPKAVDSEESSKLAQDHLKMVDGKLSTVTQETAEEASRVPHEGREAIDNSNKAAGKGDPLSMVYQLNQAAKTALDVNQAREATSPSNTLRGRADQLPVTQQFQGAVKSAAPDPEKAYDESTTKLQDNQDDMLNKNQPLMTKEESESKKPQSNGQAELQRILASAQKASESGSERANSTLLNQLDVNEASAKAHRDLSQYTTQEATQVDSAQNRVEFKGALRDVQRLVASSTYNNLTDSYESWSSRFGEVLAHRIAGYINKENWNIQFRMNPASLGEISLEIDFSDKGLEGRFGSNEESTRQLLQDTLPKLRLALREILEENQGLKFDVSDFGNSSQDDESEKNASPELVEEINFESEVLLGRTLDSELSSVVGLNILV